MEEQVNRPDATPAHKKACQNRLQILNEQREDLAKELSELFEMVLSGKKKLKIYRQFKMYNDPIYRAQKPS